MAGRSASPHGAPGPAAGFPRAMPAVIPVHRPATGPRTGLDLPPRLPFERWLDIGIQLSAAATSAAWCLGDWLAYGEKAYASRYRRAIELTSLDYQTLRNYAWVARQFPLSRRRDTLSFGHHAEVAALTEPEQDFWLRKAEHHHWPVKHLRRQVRTSLAQRTPTPDLPRPGPQGPGRPALDHASHHQEPGPEPSAILQLRITPAELAACQAAARTANLTLHDWATHALHHAATT
jgi:hypothetical protein